MVFYHFLRNRTNNQTFVLEFYKNHFLFYKFSQWAELPFYHFRFLRSSLCSKFLYSYSSTRSLWCHTCVLINCRDGLRMVVLRFPFTTLEYSASLFSSLVYFLSVVFSVFLLFEILYGVFLKYNYCYSGTIFSIITYFLLRKWWLCFFQ